MNSSSYWRKVRNATRTVILLTSVCATGGCYLMQSVQGQLSLMSKREPISRVLERPTTTPAVRSQLQSVNSIRDFAIRELGLPDNGSYRSYADVKRRYVVWNVVVAPEFSVDAKEWCYPIVGCVAYRGYFVERRARSFAAAWAARGFDVNVGGVAAYSTLGHFNDPILNTMVEWNDTELAAIVFHELTHQLLYVAGDAAFNEALATTVEEEGVRRWLLSQGRQTDLKEHQVEQIHYLEVIGLLRNARTKLRDLYASRVAADVMRQRKAEEIDALRNAHARVAATWDGHSPFESWFKGTINNADLASVATYYDCVPGFEHLLRESDGDLGSFYASVKALGKLDQATRDAAVCGSADRSAAVARR